MLLAGPTISNPIAIRHAENANPNAEYELCLMEATEEGSPLKFICQRQRKAQVGEKFGGGKFSISCNQEPELGKWTHTDTGVLGGKVRP